MDIETVLSKVIGASKGTECTDLSSDEIVTSGTVLLPLIGLPASPLGHQSFHPNQIWMMLLLLNTPPDLYKLLCKFAIHLAPDQYILKFRDLIKTS